MEFGIFSNGERNNAIAADSYDEDLYEVKLVDRLGFKEAWISEHLRGVGGSRPDALSAAEPFICKAAALTKQIMLGPGVRPLPLMDPIQVAIDAAVCDHLTRGRYMFGFGVGLPTDNGMSQRGLGEDSMPVRRARMHEAIELILKCWSATEPFDYDGEFFHGRDIAVMPKPYTKPRMPVGVASSTTLGTVELAARNGFIPLLSQYDNTDHMRAHAEGYLAAAAAAGRRGRRSDIRACRLVYVSDTVRRAKDELRASIEPSVRAHVRQMPHYYERFLPASGRHEDISFDHLVDVGYYFVGDPDTVYHRIMQHYEESGGYGVLLLVLGKHFGTQRLRARSLRRFAQEVAPRLRDLNPDRDARASAPRMPEPAAVH
jgi:alkanesulfonate monooxygenase SsuD/methylene tetrahydromethanopterin reductase-like flavin-dependent oxidoreductase (luciferase family)